MAIHNIKTPPAAIDSIVVLNYRVLNCLNMGIILDITKMISLRILVEIIGGFIWPCGYRVKACVFVLSNGLKVVFQLLRYLLTTRTLRRVLH